MEKTTQNILDMFEKINQIPRCSKNEEKISQWLLDWAKENHFEAQSDAVKNVLIKVPASKGQENAPIITLQGHMDMVCEKTPDSKHDFTRDPIKHVIDGEWLTADQTTLGADNGIALAMAMVAALDDSIVHPPLELLFTVDEETGLTGANALEPGFIQGKILVNIDSEDEGVFTVGCAGGRDTDIRLDIEKIDTPSATITGIFKVGGLKGGHSGIDILEPRGNANILVGRALRALSDIAPIQLSQFEGGSAHNAIPRDSRVEFVFPENKKEEISQLLVEMEKIFQKEFPGEPNLKTSFETTRKTPGKVLSKETTKKAIQLTLAVPHGVLDMSQDDPELVETSNNFAKIKLDDNHLDILTSQRSAIMSKRDMLTHRIESVALLAGAKAVSSNGYPSWEPDMNSPLLKRSKEIYKKLFNKDAVVEIIHAGLECGIIGAKYEGMDMLSIGPTLEAPHSPDERLLLPTVKKVWDFLIELMKSYCE